MPIDLSTATISNDGEAKPVYEGGVDLSTAYISSSTIGSRKGLFRDYAFQNVLNKPIQVSKSDSFIEFLNKPITLSAIGDSENLKSVSSDIQREKRLSKPDVFGQFIRSTARTFVGLPKTAVLWGGVAEEKYFEEVQKYADKVREKRAKPNYVKWLDLNQWEDEIMIQEANKQSAYRKSVEIGKESIEHRGFFDKVNDELNRFIENDLYTKPGTVNEWTDKLSSGLASIAISYATFGIARGLQAGTVIQSLAPAGVIGLMSGGSAIEMGKEVGVDLDTRLRAGVKVAISEGAIEAVGFSFVTKYLKGGKPVVRILEDMVNNGIQEFLQDMASGVILKSESISKQDWSEIYRGAVESAVVGFIVSSPFSAMTYHAQSKSLIGDFRNQGFSDAQMESVMESVLSADPKKVQEKGDFAKLLKEQGFNNQESKKAENLIEKYGGEVEFARMMKESPVGMIATQLIQRGFSPAIALEISEKSMEQIETRMMKVFAKDMQQMGEKIAEENAHTKIRLEFMERWNALGKPEGQSEQEWYEQGIATADIIAMKVIAEAKRRGIDAVELYKSDSPIIKMAGSLAEIQSFPRSNLEFLTEDKEREIENRLRESSIDFENKKAILKGINGNVVVAPSAKEKGKWQATFVNKEGIPSGDVVRDTFEQALKEGMSDVGIPEYKLFDEKGNYLFQQKINLTPKDGTIARQPKYVSEKIKGKSLFQFVGKDIANKIMQDETGALEGEDLKVGGEGMKGFYDQILPSAMNKMIKKWDGKVGEMQIEVEDKKEKVHSIEITEKMKESIPKGLPLFQRGVPQQPRAMIDMNEEQGKRTIYLFKNADKTSLIHELAHDWVKRMFDYIKSGNADMETIKHYATLQEWLGIEEGQSDLTVEQQERFAMGLERVLAEGDLAYGSKVASTFMAFRDWVRAVYSQTGLPGEELSPEVKEFFSWFFGVEKPKRTREYIKGFSKGKVAGAEKTKEKLNKIIDALKTKAKTVKELQADLTTLITQELEIHAEDKAKFITSIKRVTSYETLVREAKKIVERANILSEKRENRNDKAKERVDRIIRELKEKNKSIKEAQADITKLITQELDLPAKDKAKFLTSIKRVSSYETLKKEASNIVKRAREYYDSNLKDKIQKNINKLLKTTSPKKEGSKVVGRYDYETNTFFEGYKNYSKMTQREASLQLQSEELATIDDVLSEQDKMRIRMLQLRANGKSSSVELYSAVLSDIERAIHIGNTAKNEQDFMKRLERKEAIDDVLAGLEKVKGDKDSVKTKIVNLYRTGFSNIYSMLNSTMGKELANKYDPEILESHKETAIHFRTKQLLADVSNALGIEVKDLNSVLEKMVSEKIEVSDIYDRVIELDRMDIIDIYLSIKNNTIMERYVKTFGEETVFDLVGRLSDKEKAFGDALLEAVGEYYPVFNERNIEITGRDLGRVSGIYWIATSEKPSDIYDEMVQSSEIYSAMKKRGGAGVIPKPSNAWFKAMKHIRAGEHIRHLSRRHEELKRLLTDIKVKNLIENKFGSDVYHHLIQQVSNISLNKEISRTNAIESVFGKVLNNWVVAKIGVNPSVFVKQLVSVGNYMEDMPVKEWTKYFFDGISKPKETFDFMWNNAPFLEARFNRGYEEAVSRAMEGAVNIGKLKENWAKALSSLVRAGDITAIIYGGYSVVKYHEAQGKSREEAVALFEKQTLKAQQSGLASGLSEFQNNRNPFARLFLAFQNTSFQYFRKQVDALVSYSNGDMSKSDLAKTLIIYSVIQPSLYIFAGNFVREMYIAIGKILRGDPFDDDKEEGLFSGIIEEILTAPSNAIPVINSLVDFAVKKLKGEKAYRTFSMPLLDDIESATREMSKKDITFEEWLLAVGSITAELGAGAPVQTATRIGKKLFVGDENSGGSRRKTDNRVRRKVDIRKAKRKGNIPVRKKR